MPLPSSYYIEIVCKKADYFVKMLPLFAENRFIVSNYMTVGLEIEEAVRVAMCWCFLFKQLLRS